jgi:hypothetical protein
MQMGHAFILIESSPRVPAVLEKARDANGEIRTSLLVFEPRPVPLDYGKGTMVCGTTGPINPTCPAGQICNPNPTCPVGQVCNPNPGPVGGMPPPFMGSLETVKTALLASQNAVMIKKDSMQNPIQVTVDPSTLKQDTLRKNISVNPVGQPGTMLVFLADSTGRNLFLIDGKPVCGAPSTTGPVPGPGPAGILFLRADLQDIQGGLAMSQNMVFVVRDSAGRLLDEGPQAFDPGSMKVDTMMKAVVGNIQGKPDMRVAFLAQGDIETPMTRNNLAVVLRVMAPPPPGGTTCPVGQTCPPPGGTTPGDTTKPVTYKGNLEDLRAVLAKQNWMAELMTPNGPQVAEIDDSSVMTDGVLFMASEVGQPTRIYVFMGRRENPAMLLTNMNGRPIVTLKPTFAGP